jgi:hypothetical protein
MLFRASNELVVDTAGGLRLRFRQMQSNRHHGHHHHHGTQVPADCHGLK